MASSTQSAPDDVKAYGGIAPLSNLEFSRFQALIYREAGIFLNDTKHALLSSRLQRRLRELGLSSFTDYYRKVVDGDQAELVQMLDCISTNQTSFFRESDQFDFLVNTIFPAWRQRVASGSARRDLRIWSAACSTGQEPYSLAMLLLSHFPSSEGWCPQILATDINTQVLETARKAVWPVEKAEEIPLPLLKRFMLRGTAGKAGVMKASRALQAIISFERLNLIDETYAVRGPFDAIFCRNVLIYFKRESRAEIIDRLLDHLRPGGLLFVGRSETLSGVTDRVQGVSPSVYTLK